MSWFSKVSKAMAAYAEIEQWFEKASKDGVLTADEISEGVLKLVRLLGYEDKFEIKL